MQRMLVKTQRKSQLSLNPKSPMLLKRMVFWYQRCKNNRFLKRTLIKTGDGSFTLHLAEWDEQYHSKHGAIAEALHVFIQKGLYHWCSQNAPSNVSILEIGFGTGLNCFLTFL